MRVERQSRYVCRDCQKTHNLEYGAKDAATLHTCYMCRKFRYCRLSDLRAISCQCTCACRDCLAVRRKNHRLVN